MDDDGTYRPPHLAAVAVGPYDELIAKCEDCPERLITSNQQEADDWVRQHSRGDLKSV
jgi:hypothetical protein